MPKIGVEILVPGEVIAEGFDKQAVTARKTTGDPGTRSCRQAETDRAAEVLRVSRAEIFALMRATGVPHWNYSSADVAADAIAAKAALAPRRRGRRRLWLSDLTTFASLPHTDPDMLQPLEPLPSSRQSAAVAEYLQTGRHDVYFSGWAGSGPIEREQRGTADLKAALIAEIRHRAPKATAPAEIRDLDPAAFARQRLTPMVSGLFPQKEWERVLGTFEGAIVFLTPDNIEQMIAGATWLSTAWELANLYLGSVGAGPLGDPDDGIVGYSEGTTCYISMEYFKPRQRRFADFVVHEAAHVFHNCKRRTIGLSETRRREWLLDIEYRKRETFAYACEAYSRILEIGRNRQERLASLDELTRHPLPSDERIDAAEYLEILREAVTARNGWKRILARCAPRQHQSLPHPRSVGPAEDGILYIWS